MMLTLAGCSPATRPADVRSAAGGKADDPGATATATRPDVIYLAIPDRFFNGDSSNDQLGLPGCFDPSDPQKFHGGDWTGLRQKLGYLQELGADTLWITPAYKQATGPAGRCGYHGYWADFTDPDDAAVEPTLGTADELAGLAGDLHAAGMRLVLDMVVNHAGDGARIFGQHPDWFHDPSTCQGIIQCPYRDGVHDFAQEQPEVASYLSALSAGWVSRLGVDGIRMDTARYVLPSYFQNSWVPAVRAQDSGLFLVAEVFSTTASDLTPYLNAGFDAAFGFPVQSVITSVFAHGAQLDKLADAVATERKLYPSKTIVHMIDNHDLPRFVNQPGFGVPEDEIRRRLHLALTAIFTLPGVPQLYMGDELGMYGGDDPDNRRDIPDWAWSSDGRSGTHAGVALPNSQLTFALVQKLAALRPLFRADDYRELWRPNGGADVYAFERGDVITILNGGDWPSGHISMSAPFADGTIFDEKSAQGAPSTLTVSGGHIAFEMPGKTAGVYVRRQ
jgi:alpha-amylase